jgi:hypothetical protein
MGKAEIASGDKKLLALRIAMIRVLGGTRAISFYGAVLLGFFLVMSFSGCGARNVRAAVPGCGGQAYVPSGCYAQTFADHLEVRCGKNAVSYWCKS